MANYKERAEKVKKGPRVDQSSEILKKQTNEENELEKVKLSVQRIVEESRKLELEVKKEKWKFGMKLRKGRINQLN